MILDPFHDFSSAIRTCCNEFFQIFKYRIWIAIFPFDTWQLEFNELWAWSWLICDSTASLWRSPIAASLRRSPIAFICLFITLSVAFVLWYLSFWFLVMTWWGKVVKVLWLNSIYHVVFLTVIHALHFKSEIILRLLHSVLEVRKVRLHMKFLSLTSFACLGDKSLWVSNLLYRITLWKEALFNHMVRWRKKPIRVGLLGWQQFLYTSLQYVALCVLKLSSDLHRWSLLFLSVFIIRYDWTGLAAEYVWILVQRRVLAYFAFEHTFSALYLALIVHHSQHIRDFNENFVLIVVPLALAVTVCLFHNMLFFSSTRNTWNG
jgi:hypothetical protein